MLDGLYILGRKAARTEEKLTSTNLSEFFSLSQINFQQFFSENVSTSPAKTRPASSLPHQTDQSVAYSWSPIFSLSDHAKRVPCKPACTGAGWGKRRKSEKKNQILGTNGQIWPPRWPSPLTNLVPIDRGAVSLSIHAQNAPLTRSQVDSKFQKKRPIKHKKWIDRTMQMHAWGCISPIVKGLHSRLDSIESSLAKKLKKY